MLVSLMPSVDPNIWEPPYFLKALEWLKFLDDSFHFIIARTNTIDEINEFKKLIDGNKKNILIRLSDEVGDIPSYTDELFLTFRTYNRRDLYDNNKIFPLPCGYSCGTRESLYVETEKIPLIDREYDIFYSGQMSSARESMKFNLDKIKDGFKSMINYTAGFSQGFKLEDYYHYMRNAKIGLVPDGAMVPESFRYFEAFESNCIVITTYPKNNEMYNHWYYDESPAIFLKSWEELTEELIASLLTFRNLRKYEILNREYFDKKISAKAIANYMLKIILDKSFSI